MIDLHCHVLPGIDDGPETIEGSLALARAAAAGGVQTIVATPHVSRRYPNDAATIARLVGEVNEHLAAEGIAVQVRPGAEIALTSAADMAPEQIERLGLGGAGGWLLIEPPFTPAAGGIDMIVLDIVRQGHRVVLAHPERCPAFHRDRAVLEALVRAGVLTSITAGSLIGSFGADVRRFARGLVRDGLVHNVASDAHDHLMRPPGIADELRQAHLQALTGWFTEQVPGAILSGDEIPPPPAAAIEAIEELQSRSARRRWWRRWS
jgi:protein-tyrosine phosphatase